MERVQFGDMAPYGAFGLEGLDMRVNLGHQQLVPVELLELTPDERALLDLKYSLGDYLRRNRLRSRLGRRVRTARVRWIGPDVEPLEAVDASVSLDLFAKAALAASAERFGAARLLAESASRRS